MKFRKEKKFWKKKLGLILKKDNKPIVISGCIGKIEMPIMFIEDKR